MSTLKAADRLRIARQLLQTGSRLDASVAYLLCNPDLSADKLLNHPVVHMAGPETRAWLAAEIGRALGVLASKDMAS